ncbi:hypothetical protein C8Q70DRAFT_1051514 [Cubamyces menziesii]|nr:hypothetical protein C8Q70DRAFT_1051514 [Cubamyces menziesii]
MHQHGAPRNMQQRHRRVGDLEERAPALINLPFPDPSIPILDPLLQPLAPILTPLIDGQHPATQVKTTTTSTTPPATQSPTPSPTSAATSPSSPTNTPSGGNSGGSTGGSSGSGGNSGSGSGGSNGSGGGSDGSGSSPDPSGNSPTNPPASNPSNPGAATPTVTGNDGAPSGSQPAGSPSSNGQGSGAPNGSAGSASSVLVPVINANGANFVSGTSSALFPTQTGNDGQGGDSGSLSGTTIPANAATPTGIEDPSGRITGSSSNGSGASPTNSDPSHPSTQGDDSIHHGLSTGIIVAISLIAALLLLVLLFCCCRRRAIAARVRRRRNWFAAGAYGAGIASDEFKDGGAGTRSARSSFATNIDRGQMITPVPPPMDFDFAPPPSDQMSQVWPSNMSGSITVPPVSRTVESMPSPTVRAAPDRTSLSSLSSSGSSRPPSQTSQYLALPGAAATAEGSPFGHDFPSPFSVRPFSPSETFSFPRPPQDDATSRASGMPSGSMICASSDIHSAAFFTAEDHPASSPVPAGAEENPFLDFTEIAAAGRPTSTSTESSPLEHFAAVETIRRPFVPTMDDEMAVVPGQEVRILKRFDDGWAFAETVPASRQGLIPIDCLRPVEEDLPAFLAKKRLSSYVPGQAGQRTTLMSQRTSVLSGTSVGKAM